MVLSLKHAKKQSAINPRIRIVPKIFWEILALSYKNLKTPFELKNTGFWQHKNSKKNKQLKGRHAWNRRDNIPISNNIRMMTNYFAGIQKPLSGMPDNKD